MWECSFVYWDLQVNIVARETLSVVKQLPTLPIPKVACGHIFSTQTNLWWVLKRISWLIKLRYV